MRIVCKIKDHLGRILTQVKVVVMHNNQEVRLKFNSKDQSYVGKLDAKAGEILKFLIESIGFEKVEQCTYLEKKSYEFVIGPKGSKYLRCGDKRLPFVVFEGVFGVSGSTKKVKSSLEKMNLVPLESIDGVKMPVNTVFIKKEEKGKRNQNRKRLTKSERNEFNQNLKKLREESGAKGIGPVIKREGTNSACVLSSKLRITPKKGVSLIEFNKLLNDYNFRITGTSEDQFIVEGPADCGLDLFDVSENLFDSGLIESIYPIILRERVLDYTPGNFLWNGQYSHKIIRVHHAWGLLDTRFSPSRKFGIGDIMIGVDDSGLPEMNPGTAQPEHHSFQGQVIKLDGTPADKIFRRRDFLNNVDNNNSVNVADEENDQTHGMNICGISSGNASPNGLADIGTAGVAPASRLFPVISLYPTDIGQIVAMYNWMAGFSDYNYAGPKLTKLTESPDIIMSSLGTVLDEATDGLGFKEFVEKALRRGRKGRGMLMVRSGGNDSTHIDYTPGGVNRLSAYENVLSIGAVSIFPDETELKKSVYSNTGKIDFCAPSNSGLDASLGMHDPPRRTSTWTSTFDGNGQMPGVITHTKQIQHELPEPISIIETGASVKINVVPPKLTVRPYTKVDEEVSPGESVITVENTTDFTAGIYAIIHEGNNSEKFQISAVGATTITISDHTKLKKEYTEKAIITGGTALPYSKLGANATSGTSTITVEFGGGFTTGMYIYIKDKTNSNNEFKVLTAVAGGVLTFSGSLANNYLITDDVIIEGLTEINVANDTLYKFRDRIILEYNSYGKKVWDYVSVRGVFTGKILVDSIDYNHLLEVNTPIVTKRFYYSIIKFDCIISKVTASYNPTESITATVSGGSTEVFVSNAGNFKPGTIIKIGTGVKEEWKKIVNVTGTKLELDSGDSFANTHNTPTNVVGYPALEIADPNPNLPLSKDDHLKIEHDTLADLYVETLEKVSSTTTLEVWALRPKLPEITDDIWKSVTRVPGVRLNNTTDLNEGDKLLLGDPGFDLITKKENSQTVKIEKKVDAETIILDSSRRGHPVLTNLYKGSNDYTDSFGGTSSSSPIVAGVIALMLSANPDLTWAEIIYLLRVSSEVIDKNTKGYSGTPSDVSGEIYYDHKSILTLSPSNADPGIRPLREGQWKNKYGDYLYEQDGVTINPLIDLSDPASTAAYKSAWYGFGMVDAEAAVSAAITYNSNARDLVIRDTLADLGTAANASNLEIDSPDIWVRNVSPDELLVPPLDYASLSYSDSGPHQLPLTASDHMVYARVKNIGTLLPSLEAEVRFYLVLDESGVEFKFPDHFTESGKPESGSISVKLIGKVTLEDEELAAEGHKVVGVPWPKELSDPTTVLETNILVEITPHDGPFMDPDSTGAFLWGNNNLSRKKMVFVDFIEITGAPGLLPASINILSTEVAVPVTSDFDIRINDPMLFATEDVKLVITRYPLDGLSEEIIYEHDGASWNYNTTPVDDWLVIENPLIEPFAPSDFATGDQQEVRFTANFTVNGTHEKVVIKAEYSNSEGVNRVKEKKISVNVLDAESSTFVTLPNEKNDIYFFTEYDLLSPTQPAAKAFGPDSIHPTTKYNVTSIHSVTADAKAFAISNGLVLVQETSDPDLVNVVIKPSNQGIIDFLNVKYYVYRGILKASLIEDTDNELIAAFDTNEFINSIHDTQNKINRAIEEADPNDLIEPDSIAHQPSSKSLGIHFVSSVVEPGQIEKLDTDSLDEIFYDSSSDYRFPLIKKGQEFGLFKSGEIGLDIILEGMTHTTTFGEVRGSKHFIEVPLAPASPSLLERLVDQKNRTRILNYMDPAAFFAIHMHLGFRAMNSSETESSFVGDDVYSAILVKFHNKDKTYLDIRNENGYYFNYYGNYTIGATSNEIALSYEDSVLPVEQVFSTDLWPIKIISNADFAAGNSSCKNMLRLQLPLGDNSFPLLYKPYAVDYHVYPDYKLQKKFLDITFSGLPISEIIELAVPNREGGAGTESIASYIRLVYVKRNDLTNFAINSTEVFGLESLDHVFPMLNLSPWDTTNNISFVSGVHERHIQTKDFSFVGEVGMAVEPSRIILYAVPETIHRDGKIRTTLYKRILGGTSNKTSFFEILKSVFPNFGLVKTELTVLGESKFYLNYDDAKISGYYNTDKYNFFCVGLTLAEYDALNISAAAVNINSDYHFPTLVIKSKEILVDDNHNGYFKYDLGISGINNSGEYVIAPLSVIAYSSDGVMITSSDFAEEETSESLNHKCIEFAEEKSNQDSNRIFTDVGRVIKRVSLFSDLDLNTVRAWKMFNADGTPLMYENSDQTNFGDALNDTIQIEIPVGTRIVMLECRKLAVETLNNLNYIRIVCFYNGAFREGYISQYAVWNSTDERVLPTEGVFDDEIMDATINDIKMDVVLTRKIVGDPTLNPDWASDDKFATMLANLEIELDPSEQGSFINRYNTLSTIEKSRWIRVLKNAGDLLGFNFKYYDDPFEGTRIDFPASVENYKAIIKDALNGFNEPDFLIVPFNFYWTGGNMFEGYHNDISSYCAVAENFQQISNELIGKSGSSVGVDSTEDFDQLKIELKNLRKFLRGEHPDYPLDPNSKILSTKEGKWFIDDDRLIKDGVDYFDTFKNFQFISTMTWESPENPTHLETDYFAEYITIDHSMGFVNSNNVLSVLIHEMNVSQQDVVKLVDETHSFFSESPSDYNWDTKRVAQTAWEYVGQNDFVTFFAHGFHPRESYVDVGGNKLGAGQYSATKNIADFLQRNPSIGAIYAQHIIKTLKEIL